MAQMLKIDNFEAGFKAARYKNVLFFSQPFANPIDVYAYKRTLVSAYFVPQTRWIRYILITRRR